MWYDTISRYTVRDDPGFGGDSMTIREALDICGRFWRKNGNYDEDTFFVYTEALEFLIRAKTAVTLPLPHGK